MPMIVPLPPPGDVSWYDWAAEIHSQLDAITVPLIGYVVSNAAAARPTSSAPVIWATSSDPAAAINGDIRIRVA